MFPRSPERERGSHRFYRTRKSHLGLPTTAAARNLPFPPTAPVDPGRPDCSCLQDDTAAVQAAVDAVHASGGGLVLLPSGAYNISGSVAVRGDYILLRGGSSAPVAVSGSAGVTPVDALRRGMPGRDREADSPCCWPSAGEGRSTRLVSGSLPTLGADTPNPGALPAIVEFGGSHGGLEDVTLEVTGGEHDMPIAAERAWTSLAATAGSHPPPAL